MIRARLVLIHVLAAMLILSACGGGDDGSSLGALLFSLFSAGTYRLVERDIATGGEIELTVGGPSIALKDPAVSPDGQRIVYIEGQPQRVVDGVRDTSADVWIMSRDGSDRRALHVHERANQTFSEPRWLDGTHVLVVMRLAGRLEDPATWTFSLERIDVDSGTRERVMDGVLSFGLSPDASTMAFVLFGDNTETLEIGAPDGSGRKTIVESGQGMHFKKTPRFSPDGEAVVFSALEMEGAVAPGRLGAPLPYPLTHGQPEDLYVVDAEGGPVRVFADLNEDEPHVAWGDDVLYAVGAEAIFAVDPETGAAERVTEAAAHSRIDWTAE
jgi:Tol biopolymer transport system component